MLELKLRRIGSSLGVLLPKKALDAAELREGDTITVPRIGPKSAIELYGVWRNKPVKFLEDDA